MRKTYVLLASAAWGLAGATAAAAQVVDTATSGTTAEAQGQNTQSQDAQATGLQDIVVTAQRRSESLQNVPISITAADSDALASARVENVSNIQAISPSISFRVTNIASSSANLIIRGLGTTGNSRSFEGSVGVFIDGVYRSRAASALQNFLDIENLQVLRGPQGTLFGKNTSAGALLLTSASPSLTAMEGLVDVSVSNFDTVLTRAAVSVPVSDTLSVRVAGLASTRDGFFTNPGTGRPLNGDSSQALKGQIRWEPSANFSLRLIGDYSLSSGNCCYATADFINGPTQPLINALTVANGFQVPSSRLADFESSLNSTSTQRIKDYGGTALMTLALGSGELRSVTALRRFSVAQRDADADFSGAAILSLDEGFSSRFFSQELTYNGKIEAANADLVLGGFFSDEKLRMDRDLFWGSQAQPYWNTLLAAQGLPPGTAAAVPGRVATEAMNGRAKSYAAFGHVDFAIGDKFNVIAGLRYSVEEKEGAFRYLFYDPRPNAVFRVLGVSPGPSYDSSTRNRALSGTFGLQYRPVDDVMLYATYNRGFKAGGVNIDANGAGTVRNNPAVGGTPLDPRYRPETVNAYEAGAKIRYLDRRARTNIAFFYYDIEDVQIAQFVGLQFAVLNAKSATDYGVEVENLFQITPALTLGLDGTWLPRARYGVDAGIDPVLSGSRFRFAPKFQGNATLNLDQPITDDINLTGRVQYQYAGRQLVNTASLAERKAVGLIDANLGFKTADGLSVEVWGQNLTNKIYPTQLFNTPLQTGDQNAYLAPPRTYGVRLRARF
ncbi:TonB-dependent receptor [Sphingomonas mucosissima]|uniref:Pesticin receptor n=1 Tax=Sphingomonas mucosissima TaxID=370959 RepID=A0A245ZJF7_9SPHN|nr:TonB-dependent receptor [Sphingomonas mucosissima]OWK29882.1 pesticin receptor precursor [Sphingomonas mucosissima]